MLNGERNRSGEKGLTLIECAIALVVTTIGLLAVAQLLGVGIRLQTESRDSTAAGAFARSKLEELENYPPMEAHRARGGSLTTNVDNYNDIPDTRFQRRWMIESSADSASVPANMQRISVV